MPKNSHSISNHQGSPMGASALTEDLNNSNHLLSMVSVGQRLHSRSSDLQRSTKSLNVGTNSLSNTDNTFDTARQVRSLGASSLPINVRIQGTVGQADRVDVFKFDILPGANFPSNNNVFRASGGRLKVDFYAQHPIITGGQIQFGGRRTVKGTFKFFDDINPTFNATSSPIQVFIRVSTGATNVQYNLKTTYNPT